MTSVTIRGRRARLRRTVTTIQPVANKDRLTGLDSSFLHLERDSAHMHVASCSVCIGTAPSYDDLVEAIESRLQARQRLFNLVVTNVPGPQSLSLIHI